MSCFTKLSTGLSCSRKISLQTFGQRHSTALCKPYTSCPLTRRDYHSSVVVFAQPSKKGPSTTVKIYCAKCNAFLYKYRKGGTGALVKSFLERIVEDATGGQLSCPDCGSEFARPAMIRGKPANKFIGGKVIMRK